MPTAPPSAGTPTGAVAPTPMQQTSPANYLMAVVAAHHALGNSDPVRSAPVPRGKDLGTPPQYPPRHNKPIRVVK